MKINYCPPPFEEVQHDICVTRKDSDGKVFNVEVSLHSDVSLLQRIDKMKFSAQTLKSIKDSLQPVLDSSSVSSSLRSQFKDLYGSLTDDELIDSCPSRYVQTASEKRSILEHLSASHKEQIKKAKEKAQSDSEAKRLQQENDEFEAKMRDFMRNIYS